MDRDWNCLYHGKITVKRCEQHKTVRATQNGASNTKPERETYYLNITNLGIRNVYCAQKQNTFQTVHQKYVLCTEKKTLSRRYIRNVYFAQKQTTFQTVHQKCVLCIETEHFPDRTSEMCTVHRNKTLPRRYIRNLYCAQKQITNNTTPSFYPVTFHSPVSYVS